MQEARLTCLQQMPIFGGISEASLKFILGISPIVSLPKGGFFFRENDRADSMYVLEQGRAAVLKFCQNEQYVLRHLVAGDCFGEMALMDLFPRSASVVAEEDCTALQIPVANLHRLYEKDLEQFTIIQMNMGREVSRRLRELDERLFRARMGAPFGGEDFYFRSV